MTGIGAERRAAGRRRDPLIEPRVMAAAIEVYAREGWGGFTFESVARESGVGKPAIYRRWANREDLLLRAFETMHFPKAQDLGSIRADLLDYAYQWVEWYSDQSRGIAAVRLETDRLANPVLTGLYEDLIALRVEAARAITRRGIKRGEVAATVRSATIIELLVGAMQTHWILVPEAQLPTLYRHFTAYAENVVDIIVCGLQAVAPPAPAADGSPGQARAVLAGRLRPDLTT